MSTKITQIIEIDGDASLPVVTTIEGAGASSSTIPSSSPAAGLPSGAIVLFTDNGPHDGFTLLGPALQHGIWSTGAPMPWILSDVNAEVVGEKIYVFGADPGGVRRTVIYDT